MLDRMFRTDSPFWQTMGLLYDIAIVNLLWIALSMPLVTAGGAATAAHDTARRVLEDRGDSAARVFLASFRANVRQGAALGLVAALAIVATVAAWLATPFQPAALPIAVLLTVATAPTLLYLWAVQARFANPWHRTVRVAFVLAYANPRWTLLALAVDAALLGIAVATVELMPQAIPLLAITGAAAMVFLTTPILERALAPHVSVSGDPAARHG